MRKEPSAERNNVRDMLVRQRHEMSRVRRNYVMMHEHLRGAGEKRMASFEHHR